MNLFHLIDAIGWTLLHFLWQGLLIAGACALALRMLRNADPIYRYNVACIGLLACAMWPAAELYLRLKGGATGSAPLDFASGFSASNGHGAGNGVLAYLQAYLLWIVGFWSVCAVLLALRMALGLAWIGRTARVATSDARWQAILSRMAAQFGIKGTVRLRIVEDLPAPLAVGWLRPVVLVPAALMTGMPHELLEALLAHELAHVKRVDYLVNLAQKLLEIVLFYHPAVWWISRRICTEREQIADDIAVRHTGDRRTLALALSELEKFNFSRHHLAMAANGGDLVTRVRRLMRPDSSHAMNWKAAIPILGLAAASLSVYVHASNQAQLAASAFAVRAPIADFHTCAKPAYPAHDVAAENVGTVTLGFEIAHDGRVVASRVAQSSGHPGLDQAAMGAIKLCKFVPGIRDGKPIASWMQMQYVWSLD